MSKLKTITLTENTANQILEALESCDSNMDNTDQRFDSEKVSKALHTLRDARIEQQQKPATRYFYLTLLGICVGGAPNYGTMMLAHHGKFDANSITEAVRKYREVQASYGVHYEGGIALVSCVEVEGE